MPGKITIKIQLFLFYQFKSTHSIIRRGLHRKDTADVNDGRAFLFPPPPHVGVLPHPVTSDFSQWLCRVFIMQVQHVSIVFFPQLETPQALVEGLGVFLDLTPSQLDQPVHLVLVAHVLVTCEVHDFVVGEHHRDELFLVDNYVAGKPVEEDDALGGPL